MSWLRRWWVILLALVSLTGWAVRLEGRTDAKADAKDVLSIQRDLYEIKAKLDDMDLRQRAWFCRDQPAWCR